MVADTPPARPSQAADAPAESGSGGPGDLSAKLAALRDRYRDELVEQVRVLAMDCLRGLGDPSSLRRAELAAHSIKGTARFYGLADVGDAAARLNAALRSMTAGLMTAGPAAADRDPRQVGEMALALSDVLRTADRTLPADG